MISVVFVIIRPQIYLVSTNEFLQDCVLYSVLVTYVDIREVRSPSIIIIIIIIICVSYSVLVTYVDIREVRSPSIQAHTRDNDVLSLQDDTDIVLSTSHILHSVTPLHMHTAHSPRHPTGNHTTQATHTHHHHHHHHHQQQQQQTYTYIF